jgi:hypothetical protein
MNIGATVLTAGAVAASLGVLCGCTANRPRLGLAQARVPNRERIVDRNEWIDIHDAPLRYRHISEESRGGAYRILISERGDYCVVDGATYTMARDGERWACDWRVPRP